jgi:chromosome segregation ATPase
MPAISQYWQASNGLLEPLREVKTVPVKPSASAGNVKNNNPPTGAQTGGGTTPSPRPAKPSAAVAPALEGLIQRIAEMEVEQKLARERIEQLTRAKQGFQQAVAKIRSQKELTEQEQAAKEKLLQELSEQIAKKEEEQKKLREHADAMLKKTNQEVAMLKAERDAALIAANSGAARPMEAEASGSGLKETLAVVGIAVAVGVLGLALLVMLLK